MIYLLTLLQILDGYTTHRILKNGGRELNPIMAKLFAKFPYKTVLAVKGVLVVAMAYAVGEPVTTIICVIYAGVVIFNSRSL